MNSGLAAQRQITPGLAVGTRRKSASSYAAIILADTPVAYYRHSESSGDTLVDSSGNGWDGNYLPNSGGSWTGGTLGETGIPGAGGNTAVLFDGTTGYAHATSLIFNHSLATFEVWIYLSSHPPSAGSIVGCQDGVLGSGTFDKVLYIDSSGQPYWYCYSSGGKLAWHVGSLTLNAWHHIVGVADGTDAILYVDGSAVNSVTCGPTFNGYSLPNLFINGQFSSSSYLPGTIDEVAVYNYALSPTQVAAHYAAGI